MRRFVDIGWRIDGLCILGFLVLLSVFFACAEGQNPTCGDGACENGETPQDCPEDCRTMACGDGVCAPLEGVDLCPADCFCGNGSCDVGETWGSCTRDCGPGVCGDGFCQSGENPATCSGDCFCGNGSCDEGESPADCSEDCSGPFCGNGVCDSDETTSTCPRDCPSGCNHPLCDLWPPCGCGENEKCSLDLQWNHICDPAGSLEHGDGCTDLYDCVEGTTCLELVPDVGACSQFCDDDEDCQAGPGSICSEEIGGAPPHVPGLCTLNCNPLNNNGCPAGTRCFVFKLSDGRCGSFCHGPPGTSTGSCTANVDCVAGMVCDGSDYMCRYYCRRNLGDDDCPVGQHCYRLVDPIVIGSNEYGICAP